MNSKLEEIYYDNCSISEKINCGEGYFKCFNEYNKIHDELESGLNEKQKKLLDDLFIASGGMESEFGLSAFKEGFKTALLIAIETLI